jgi:hypothetical protein
MKLPTKLLIMFIYSLRKLAGGEDHPKTFPEKYRGKLKIMHRSIGTIRTRSFGRSLLFLRHRYGRSRSSKG